MCSNTLTNRLTNTARVLESLPAVLDLADDRELAILAAVLEGYAACGGPGSWENEPGYFEQITFAALIDHGRPIDSDAATSQDVHTLQEELYYLKAHRRRRPRQPGELDILHPDLVLLREAIHLATFGEPIAAAGTEQQPCTMARAFEIALANRNAKPEQPHAAQARRPRRRSSKPRTAAPPRNRGRKTA